MRAVAVTFGMVAVLLLAPGLGNAANAQPQVQPQVTAQIVKAQVVNAQIVKPQVVKAQIVKAQRVTGQRVSLQKISIRR